MPEWLDKLLYTDPAGEKQKREEKKNSKIDTPAQESQSQQPLVVGGPSYNNGQFPQTSTPVMGGNYTFTPSVPNEEVEKCKVYFGKLMNVAREQNKSYNQFLATLETVRTTDPAQPIANAAKLAFNLLKMTTPNISKDVLISDMNNVLVGIVNDKSTSFKEKQDKRQKEGVDDNLKMIESKQQAVLLKQQEIQKLNEEILGLQNEVAQARQTIEIKNTCYDMVQSGVVSHIKEEIALVTNYI